MAPGPAPELFCDLEASRGIRVYYEFHGPNKPAWQGEEEELLLLLMGSAADLRKTTDQQYINLSSQCFRILTYDHRNTGRTTVKDEPCTLEDYADDAAALLEAVVPERLPVHVLGVSFGGMVAQHLAIRHPHLIKRLVLCCCATGGEGGSSYPIHEWYAPGVTVEERVVRKALQANRDRDEAWRERSKAEWEMVRTLLTRDEQVGAREPLRLEGIMRQLDARREHDTWDDIGKLEMPVLCLASDKDDITPAALTRAMAERIGRNAEAKLDFGWGHPFVAADAAAMPFVNTWLRGPGPAPDRPGGQLWRVVGGSGSGGIIVREGQALGSAQAAERLSHGALLREVQLSGDRLSYELLEGSGPPAGWVSVGVKGRQLCARV